MSVRKAAVSGSFYPLDRKELSDLIRACYLHPLGPGRLPPESPTAERAVAVVAPHAGYAYSGPVAAHSYLHASCLRDPEVVVVVAPNHYAVGDGVSTFRDGFWETPLGRMRVDKDAAEAFVEAAGVASFDPDAHRLEHSLEVQLPFLQQLYGDAVRLLPVSLIYQDPETAKSVAAGVLKAIRGKRAVVIASSDMTHYEPAADAAKKDSAVLREVEEEDVGAFYSALERLNVTACGFGPIAAVMEVAKGLGLARGELLKYATSGDTTGDNLQVVGYASLRFVR